MALKAVLISVVAAASFVAAFSALAQETAPALTLQLNNAQPSDKGCRLTFVVNNGLGADLSGAAFEVALFDKAGIVERLTVLDFKDLPAGKTKVTRFDLAGTDCAKLSRVLINSVTKCAGAEPGACQRALKTESKAGIAFGT
jgi:hypothetical protein